MYFNILVENKHLSACVWFSFNWCLQKKSPNKSCGSLNWRFGLQTQYVLKQPSETWDGKPRRILPTLRVSPTYVFLHRTLAIEPTHSIRHCRTRGRVIYAESASDLTTHKLKFTHQPGSFNLMATKNLPKALEIRCFGIGEYDSDIAKGCFWMAMTTQALRALSRYEN